MPKGLFLVRPAFHKVGGRTVVVVGGAEATAKVRLLRESEAHIRLVGQDQIKGTKGTRSQQDLGQQ